MRYKKLLVMVIMTIIPMAILVALPSIELTVPQPGDYGIEELWKATITNPDTQTYTVWLEGKIEEASQGEVFWAQSNSFALPPGTKIVRYRDIRVLHTRTAPGYEQIVVQTGTLPEGDYTFTICLMPMIICDTDTFDIIHPGPPQLLSPRDGDSIITQQPTFTWDPPAPTPPGVTYEIKIVEIYLGQTAMQAIQANPPWFQQRDIRVPNLPYPMSARDLDKGKAYAWQVTAYSGGAKVGVSEEWSFETKNIAFWCHINQLNPDGAITLKDVVYGGGSSIISATVIAALGRKLAPWVVPGSDPGNAVPKPTVWRRERNVSQGSDWTQLVNIPLTNQVAIDHLEVKQDEYEYEYKASSNSTPNGTYQVWCGPLRLRSNLPKAIIKINGIGRSSWELVEVGPWEDIILDGSGSTNASAYFVSVWKANTSWEVVGSEHMSWLQNIPQYYMDPIGTISNFNIRLFCFLPMANPPQPTDPGYFMTPGNYIIKLAVGNPWNSVSVRLRIRNQ